MSAAALLSDRQCQVLRLAANGYSNVQIARGMCLSRHTVINHLYGSYRKLRCAERTTAAIALLDRESPRWRCARAQ